MKTFLMSLCFALLAIPSFASDGSTPLDPKTSAACPSDMQKKYVSELGLVFPVKTDAMKNYINSNTIVISPLTSGFSAGFQYGRHRLLNDRATLGVLLGGNMFVASAATTTQVYQLGAYLTGRLYFGETWRNGVFAEVGAGPEFAGAVIQSGDFQFQSNFASRFGIGYNYQFSKDVTLGLSAVVSPSLMSDNYFDGARVVVNMLW